MTSSTQARACRRSAEIGHWGGEGGDTDFLAFEFELADSTGPLVDDGDQTLNVLADLRLFVGAEPIYRDDACPVIELALALDAWAGRVEATGEPFCYDSRTSPIGSLFRIMRGAQGWYFTSRQLELPSASEFTLEQILTEVRRFIAGVEAHVFATHGFSPLSLAQH